MQAVQTVTEGELLNIDGKTLRGAKEAGIGATHAVDERSEACRQTGTSARRASPRRKRMHPQILAV